MRSLLLASADVQPPPLLLKPAPDVASSAAAEAIAFAEEVCGIYLDDWQRWVVEQALAERSDGSWAAFEVGIVCPRQNGKNFILEVVQIACIYLFGDQTLVHSAHKFDTSVEHFNRLKWIFENTPELSELLLPNDGSFVTSNGKEHIRFRTGQRILFKARYRGGGRGFTGDKVFLDEAYDLPARAIGSLIPTLSTRPMAQVWYTSSAPHESSTVLHAVRNRAIAKDDGDRLFYVEWGNPATANDGDLEAIRRANPAVLSGHITEAYILQEMRTFSGDAELVEEHRRERLGIATPLPSSTDPEPKMAPADWSATAIPADKAPHLEPGEVVIGFDVTGGWGSVTLAAGTLARSYVECIRHESGWSPARLVELVKTWKPSVIAVDGGTGENLAAVSETLEAFQLEGIDPELIKVLSTVQYKTACQGFVDAVAERRVSRPKVDPDNLEVAGAKATERVIGDSWVWDTRTARVPLAPLKAATVARSMLNELAEAEDEAIALVLR